MSTTTKLGDDVLCIPKLDVSGSNWVIFKDRFLWSVDARGLTEHVNGTSQSPKDPLTSSVRLGVLSDAQKLVDKEWQKELGEWNQGEAIAKQQITNSIPNSLFMKIHSKPTAYDIWKDLEGHFQNRSRMVSVDLRRRLQDQRCPKKGDIIAHFATLCTMREDLAAMGQPLSKNDFYAIILGSLPGSYDPYISAVNATSGVLGKTISADDLILTITEEYERQNLESKNGKKDENVALYSNDAEKGRKGGSSSKKNVECYNCKKKGHYKSECWAPGGGKEGQGPNQKEKGKAKAKETAGTAKEKDEDKEKEKQVEEAWLAMIDEDELPDLVDCSDSEDEDELPDLVDCSDSEDEDDLVKEINNQSKMSDDEAAYNGLDTIQLAGVAKDSVEVDLYDSGATRHMSGFHHKFIDFVEIEPIPITAADKRTFKATGKGDMRIYLPNGNSVLLKSVLYAPSMGITLVSISWIANAGLTVVFSGDICKIYDKNKEVIGEIEGKGGLYRVYSSNGASQAQVADEKETVSIDELHRRLGHVLHERIKFLVKKGLVKGIELDPGVEATICESCEWAKGQRKQVSKI